MFRLRHTLGSKIVGILVFYFIVAFVAIGLTLHVSTQLDGGAAAINDAGSQRMRTYRMALLVTLEPGDAAGRQRQNAEVRAEVHGEIARFERVLADLEQGNPARPLFLPREKAIVDGLAGIRQSWNSRLRPLIEEMLMHPPGAGAAMRREDLQPLVDAFAGRIDELVTRVERSNSRYTALLRSLQVGLVVLAFVGTAILILWFHLTVLRPLARLRDGIQRMAAADFSVRLPVEQGDEFGELADGFNRMAAELEHLYTTFEQRLDEKTAGIAEQAQHLAEKNRELASLYEIATFLNESASLEGLCRGFLRRVLANTKLSAGAVRLLDPSSGDIRLVVHEGVSAEFARNEAVLCPGECLCGEAAQRGVSLARDLEADGDPPIVRIDCRAEGFRSAAVFTIHHQRQLVGMFNLYSPTEREFPEREMRLLEMLGQHLGLAIENLRLVSREKEMAVSEERNLLAQELHDSIAQSLAFINIQAQLLAQALERGDIGDARTTLNLMGQGIQESYDHVRQLLLHFRARTRQSDLGAALQGLLAKFGAQTGVATSFNKIGADITMPPEVELQVLNIVEEALSNVRKHARARNVVVETSCLDNLRSVTVRDDGIGFDPVAHGTSEDHIGLQVMRDRATRSGCRLTVRAEPGAGTTVKIDLPWQAGKPARRRDDHPDKLDDSHPAG